ncbi:MAG: hypothetical protein AB7U92_24960 [Piscinibacter sp.]
MTVYDDRNTRHVEVPRTKVSDGLDAALVKRFLEASLILTRRYKNRSN